MSLISILLGVAGVAVAAQAASSTEIFNCPEGIPLVVEFVNLDEASTASVSIDGSPVSVLNTVESGSGSMYSNGQWTLHVKVDTAIITTPSGEDICTQ